MAEEDVVKKQLALLTQHVDETTAHTLLAQLKQIADSPSTRPKRASLLPDLVHSSSNLLAPFDAAEMSEQDLIGLSTWVLENTLRGIWLQHYPLDGKAANNRYLISLRMLPFVLATLVLLTFFEPPAWCGSTCASQASVSGIPLLPRLVGSIFNILLLLLVVWHLWAAWRVDSYFTSLGVTPAMLGRPRSSPFLIMVALGMLESCAAVVYTIATGQGLWLDSLQPLLRVLLFMRLPSVRQNFVSMSSILHKVAPVAAVYAGAVAFFAWFGMVIFQDWNATTGDGRPGNDGFQTFGEAMITMFSLATTAALPDAMIPALGYSKASAVVFVPFLFLTQVVLLQVVLAAVFDEYSNVMTSMRQRYEEARNKGSHHVFSLLQRGGRVSKERFLAMVEEYSRFHSSHVPASLGDVLFAAADDDGSGGITEEEFRDVCDLLQFDIWTTHADSAIVRHWPWLQRMSFFQSLSSWVTNGQWDMALNVVLFFNGVFIVIETNYDFSHTESPSLFPYVDTAFSCLYLLDVFVMLAVMSFGTYWSDSQNRFDFLTTIVIILAQIIDFAIPGYSSFTIYANILRVLRLLRMIKVVTIFPQLRRIFYTISIMLRASTEVLLFIFLVIYCSGSLGVALFGGGMDVSQENLRLFNFSDIGNSLMALVCFIMNGWDNDLYHASLTGCDRLVSKILAVIYFFSVYLVAALVAYNIFVPFAIAAFQSAADGDKELISLDGAFTLDTISVRRKREELRGQGTLLHIEPSTDLVRRRVHQVLFKVETTSSLQASRSMISMG